MPKRIQRSRRKKFPPNTRYCGRPGRWGNPFVGADAARVFDVWINTCHANGLSVARMAQISFEAGLDVMIRKSADRKQTVEQYLDGIDELRQYDFLACWCGPAKACHVDTLIRVLADGDALMRPVSQAARETVCPERER